MALDFLGDRVAEFGRGRDRRPRKRRLSRKAVGKFLGNPIDKARAGLRSTSVRPGGYVGSPGNRLRQAGAAAGNVAGTRGGKIAIAGAIAGGGYGLYRDTRKKGKESSARAYANNPYYRTKLDRNIRRADIGTRTVRNLASGGRAASDVSREIRAWSRTLRELRG